MVDSIFTEIDNYTEVADPVEDPLTNAQKCKLAYIVLQSMNKFKSDLREWDQRDPTQKSGDEFKEHFCTVQKQLLQREDRTVKQTFDNYDLINLVSNRVFDQVKEVTNNPPRLINDKNVPSPTTKPNNLILALTQQGEHLGQALATLQQMQN